MPSPCFHFFGVGCPVYFSSNLAPEFFLFFFWQKFDTLDTVFYWDTHATLSSAVNKIVNKTWIFLQYLEENRRHG
jgi:hypothetical protein